MSPRRVEAQGIIDKAIDTYGRLDILVNNSGVYEFAPLEAITEAQFHKIFDINVLGTLLTTQAAAKHLTEGGSIINIGSAVTSLTPPNSAVYTGTKGAIDAITGVLARELGGTKIRVNAINPGIVETEGTHAAGFIGSDFEHGAVAQTPLGRVGQPRTSPPPRCSWPPMIPPGPPVRRSSSAAAFASPMRWPGPRRRKARRGCTKNFRYPVLQGSRKSAE